MTITTHEFPANDSFDVLMNYMGTRGINGYKVATISSGSGGRMTFTFPIPDHLKGEYQIAIRLQSNTGSGYAAYNCVEDVSHKEDVTYDEILGIIDRHLGTQVNWAAVEQRVLGIHEIALKKGQRDYVVIVTIQLSQGQVKLLAVLPNRKKKTLLKFLRSIPLPLRRTIHTVCTDMWQAYLQAVKRVLPEAKIVVDRFHVAQKYHQAADKLRQKELKRLKQALPETEYQKLKGSMWAFRKNLADLSATETASLAQLLEYSRPSQ